MNESLIQEILVLSGPLPDAERYRRHLEGWARWRLETRLDDLRQSAARRAGGDRWERPAMGERQLRPTEAKDTRYDMEILTR